MESGSDALRSFRWGLARYSWIFLVSLVLVLVVLPLVAHAAPRAYTSEVLVAGSDIRTQLVAFPRYGRDIFDNGVVARRVARRYGGRPDEVIPRLVSVVTPQDSVIYHVVGHSARPEQAAGIASFAAAVFATELNKGGIASFQIISSASSPVTSTTGLGASPSQRGLGTVAALTLGLAIICILLLVRRPVVTASDAELETGNQVVAELRVPRWTRGGAGTGDGLAGLVPLGRRLARLAPRHVLVVASPTQREFSDLVIRELTRVLDTVPGEGSPEVVADIAVPDWSRDEAAVTLLVAVEGTAARSLSELAGEYAATPVLGCVFVRRPLWTPLRRRT